jgi:multicomponent Na+:H+ antiporter subunit G
MGVTVTPVGAALAIGHVTAKDALIGALLVLAVLVQLGCCVGLLVMPNLPDRLHFLTPASSLAPALVAGAVVAKESLDHQGIVAILVALFLMVFTPVISHATARAARVARSGDWRGTPGEIVHRS